MSLIEWPEVFTDEKINEGEQLERLQTLLKNAKTMSAEEYNKERSDIFNELKFIGEDAQTILDNAIIIDDTMEHDHEQNS